MGVLHPSMGLRMGQEVGERSAFSVKLPGGDGLGVHVGPILQPQQRIVIQGGIDREVCAPRLQVLSSPIEVLIKNDAQRREHVPADHQRDVAIAFLSLGPHNVSVPMLDRHDSARSRQGRIQQSLDLAGETQTLLDQITRRRDRKSTRLNSSHVAISYAVFCLKKKKYSDK